ncbi:hypothetical protein JZ751_028019 [Albula glossodonta]|uniref:Uncharacterized protein n=1 Tax=Albula glossodonta TaxID=121402 RepID=A0A8T2PEF8_9TELE|nr:hypothetical protein JZ751_028019 [Albula glossodonta]
MISEIINRSFQINPLHVHFVFNMKESEGFFLNALKINPSAASCHGNLAVLYHRWGKLDLAKKHYEMSLKLDPNAPGTKENYNMLRRKLEQQQRKTIV